MGQATISTRDAAVSPAKGWPNGQPVRAEPSGGGTGEPAHRGRPPSVRAGLLVLAVYLAGGVVAYWHVWAHPATFEAGLGTGDVAQADWFMSWLPWALGHGANPFVSHMANVPFGLNMLDQTSVMALAAVMAPVTILWGPVASVNALLTLSFPLSAFGGYLLARRFVDWRPAAFAAGLLYGYSPYMVGQGSSHLNLAFVPLPPLIMLAVHELVVRQQRPAGRWGLALAGLVVAQFFVSTEILATTAVITTIAVVVVALRFPGAVRARFGHAARGLALAVAVAGALLAFPVYEALDGPAHISGTLLGFQYYYSALFAPLLPTTAMQLGTAHMKAMGALIGGNTAENGTYLGAPLVLLLVVAAVAVKRPAVRLAAAMAGISFVLSLGISLHLGLARFGTAGNSILLPGDLLFHVPVLNDAFPVRYSLYVALFASIVLAATLDRLHRSGPGGGAVPAGRRRRLRAVLLPALVAVAVLAPLVPAWPYAGQGPVRVPAYFATSAVDSLRPGTVALVYPLATNTDASAELWQAESGFRFAMPGGYFLVGAGRGRQFYRRTLTESVLSALLAGHPPARTARLRRELSAQLRAWKVGAVLVQPVGADPVAFFTWLTGRPPDALRGGLYEWRRTGWAGPGS